MRMTRRGRVRPLQDSCLYTLRSLAVGLALALLISVALAASTPTFWTVSTQADLLKGDVENLSIDSDGRMFPGPSTSLLAETAAPFLWTVIAGPDGTLWAGSGNEGQVLKLTKDGKLSTFFDATELEVHALALAPNGGLFVGTSPDGRIYQVASDGTSKTFFDPDDKYIWALAVDKNGNVFAATGDKGVIYKITPDGKGAPFYQTKATHAISLALDAQGRLLAGTESPGRVFQIDANGKPFVLLDSSYNEIHQLRVDANGVIYAAAIRGRGPSGSTSQPDQPGDSPAAVPIPSVSTEITAIAIVDSAPVATASTGATPPPARGPGAGAIFRILPDGSSDQIWESREDTPYDIAFEPGGSLLVATGNKGKIYRLSGDPLQPTLVARANAQQITSIVSEREGRVLLATSNPGKLLRLGAARADRGSYTSDVRDAQTVAQWGTIKWQE